MRTVLAIVLMLSGTATAAKDAPIRQATCAGDEDCAVKWGRAVRWVLDRNGRIADQTDNRIATAPIEQTGENYYQVTKIPDGAGRYTFDMRIECANAFSCKWKKMKAEFASAVMADG